MSGTKITLTGADEDHYLRASKKIARLICFPDGLSRHITLSEWQWKVFDGLIENKGWHQDELANAAYGHALEGVTYPDDFEKQIRLSFRLFIEANMPDAMFKDNSKPCNDEF